MARSIDYDAARKVLKRAFASAEADYRDGKKVEVSKKIANASRTLFLSRTQAYREALVGCVLAYAQDPTIDIRYPNAKHSTNAFSGRTLDEQVVNPFFQDRAVPVSKNPYLSAIRRGVHFVPGGARGQRDQDAFNALVDIVNYVRTRSKDDALAYLRYLLGLFVALRESAKITLRRVARLSLAQYSPLIDGLLSTPSGGLMPVLLAVAMLRTLRDCFQLAWDIEWQGINVADRQSGASGDITVRRAGQTFLVVEVTERPITRDRVVSTFNTKISPSGLDDYLFFFAAVQPTDDARAAARRYFAQGHEINFIPIRDWIVTCMTTIGPNCRAAFTSNVLLLLESKDVPAAVKQTWNDQVTALLD
ncbi:MAG TPA: restriction endonuclease, SacI family [Pseudolabrys sp.]|nr:restriction endonuclease, SacI family [Pseudolabrys sp.]